jgi:hypothetical protein
MRAEDLPVHVIHRVEVVHVLQEHSATQDSVQVGSGCLENSGNVLKGAFGLLAGVTPDDLLAGLRPSCSLTKMNPPPLTACE